MPTVLANVSLLAVFNLGRGELGLILAVMAILIASRRFPALSRGLDVALERALVVGFIVIYVVIIAAALIHGFAGASGG